MNKEKVLVVADLHGEWNELNKLINKKKPDIVFQAGDFGYWPCLEQPYSRITDGVLYPAWKVKGIKPQGSKVYWCDGNHEQFSSADFFHKFSRNPIKVYKEVYYMPRGSVYTLQDGRNVMFIGGADSIDKHHRTLGVDWFKEELISYKQQNFILDYVGNIDIVISHTCPTEWKPREDLFGKEEDPTRKVLSAVLEKFKPDHWYSGHFHIEKSGKYKNTEWHSLSCPGSDGRWWKWLED